jgi:hypothetical protein
LAFDGDWLFVADSEGSSIRAVPLDPRMTVRTVVGTSSLASGRLFTFGDRDGAASQALLQHPLGVAHHQGDLYVADTYNNKIKRITLDATPIVVESLALPESLLDEPGGLSVGDGVLVVADTNHHRIIEIDLRSPGDATELAITGLEAPPNFRDRPSESSSEPPLAQPADPPRLPGNGN